MKLSLITLALAFSFQSMAQDMSRTETYEESTRENNDGSVDYIGGCSVHQDFEGAKFIVTKTIVKSFEPEYQNTASTMKKLKNADPLLLEAAAMRSDSSVADFFAQVDDVSLEKISSKVFSGLDLYRFNIGVGGGNGYYEIYNRTTSEGKVVYEKLANIFDGDVEYCDLKVWTKK